MLRRTKYPINAIYCFSFHCVQRKYPFSFGKTLKISKLAVSRSKTQEISYWAENTLKCFCLNDFSKEGNTTTFTLGENVGEKSGENQKSQHEGIILKKEIISIHHYPQYSCLKTKKIDKREKYRYVQNYDKDIQKRAKHEHMEEQNDNPRNPNLCKPR